MRTIETNVYKFDELSDSAKEKARDWYRQFVFTESHDWEFTFNEIVEIAAIIGIVITHKSNNPNASYKEPCIYFSGFSNQGDGANFLGNYSYAKGAVSTIKKNYPYDSHLISITENLQALQSKNFYGIECKITPTRRYFSIETETKITFPNNSPSWETVDNVDNNIRVIFREFCSWIYEQLEQEYYYQNSDEVIDECMAASDYEFTIEGKRYGC